MRPFRSATAALFLATSSLAQQPLDSSPGVGVILQRYLSARGGLDRIKAVRTLILHGPPRPDGRPGRWMARARPSYYVVGEPNSSREFAEGFDGAAWEYYRDPGLVLRTSGTPAAAARHTAYFDDALVNSAEPGWTLELLGLERIAERPAWWLRATLPDGAQTDLFVDTLAYLLVATRKAAPVHAFGPSIETETRISNYRPVNGALFPFRFDEYVIATGKPLADLSGGWVTAEANVDLPLNYFSPPPEPSVPLARMLNGAFAARAIPSDALRWYQDFRSNPATASIDTEAGVEALGYQCLKNEAVPAAIVLLEANVRDHPQSAAAHFGLGRAYRTAGEEAKAIAHFSMALRIDPDHARAREALATPSPR